MKALVVVANVAVFLFAIRAIGHAALRMGGTGTLYKNTHADIALLILLAQQVTQVILGGFGNIDQLLCHHDSCSG